MTVHLQQSQKHTDQHRTFREKMGSRGILQIFSPKSFGLLNGRFPGRSAPIGVAVPGVATVGACHCIITNQSPISRHLFTPAITSTTAAAAASSSGPSRLQRPSPSSRCEWWKIAPGLHHARSIGSDQQEVQQLTNSLSPSRQHTAKHAVVLHFKHSA